MSINFFQYVESISKVFTGKRYVMAVVLSKVSITKAFKSRCLCYWLMEKQLGFSCMSCESHQVNKIFPLDWIFQNFQYINFPFFNYVS